MSGGPDAEGVLGVIAEGWEGVRAAEMLRARLPREDILVVADQAFAPYARRRPDAVRQRIADLVADLRGEGAKALLLSGGYASFEARPEADDLPIRGLECGLRDALAEARGRPVACIVAVEEVRTMVLARAIRGLRGGGSMTLVERGEDGPAELVGRVRAAAPEAPIVVLLTPRAYADADELRTVAGDLTFVDALDSAARYLADDLRRRNLLAHHGLRAGRITTIATRGGTTGFTREPLSTASASALQRRR
jgi:hypothetical protein